MKRVISLFFLIIITFSACKRLLTADAYIAYVKSGDNGLAKTIKVDGWEYTMQYRPYDYIIMMENRNGIDKAQMAKRMDELKGTAWFNISYKRADNAASPMRYNISSIEEYDQRLNYLLNEAKKDIKLVYDTTILTPVSYVFENNYNLTPQETIIVGFYLPRGEERPRKKMQLSYDDQVFKNGIIKATFSEHSLQNIPGLTY